MAVDSAQKRRSMLSFGRMNYGERVPEATNFDSDTDRAEAMFVYAGLSIATVTPDPTTNTTRRKIGAFVKRGGVGRLSSRG